MQPVRQFLFPILAVILSCVTAVSGAEYHSPEELSYSPDGQWLAVGDATAGAVCLFDSATHKLRHTVALDGEIIGLAWSADGSRLYAAESGVGNIAEIDPAHGRVLSRLPVGRYPRGIAMSAQGQLLVTDYGRDRLSVIDLKLGKVIAEIPTGRQPTQVAVSSSSSTESLAVVSNLIPATAATDPNHAVDLSMIDLKQLKVIGSVRLPAGSTNARGVAMSLDGATAYVVHTLGRFHLPTTQLARGWVITNALSVIDLRRRELRATVLLDQTTDGAADPWGVAMDPQGKSLHITLSGVHQLAMLDLDGLQQLISSADPAELANDLSALHRNGLLRRIDLAVDGPRGVAVSADGSRVAVGGYFSGEVALLNANGADARKLSLGDQPEADAVRQGERIYHDANHCFQRWLSCASCHPYARADGLNWDLLNDGIGNPKNARSMLLSDRTPPMMSLGVREEMKTAVHAGFVHIQFTEPKPVDEQAVVAYIKSLQPAVSPYRERDGSLSESAERGKKIFNRPAVACASCHPAPLFTNLELVDVGTASALNQGVRDFDTPTLREIWRTPPYLHDGRAATLREVLEAHNRRDEHGTTSDLKSHEIDDLVAYLLSL